MEPKENPAGGVDREIEGECIDVCKKYFDCNNENRGVICASIEPKEKSAKYVLTELCTNNDINWNEYRAKRCTQKEANDHEEYLKENAESEIRAIVRAELVDELRGKKFSVQGGTDTGQRFIVDWSDIISGMEKEIENGK